jgi:hypothetical protein
LISINQAFPFLTGPTIFMALAAVETVALFA